MNSTLRISALVAATAMLAACGGGGGGDSTPAPPANGGGGVTNPPPIVPTNDAAQYKSYLQASLRNVLGIDDAVKTILRIPANIKTEVEAHGPFTRCQDSACPPTEDTSQWVTFPYTEGGNIRLQDWVDAATGPTGPNGVTPTDGQYGPGDPVKLDLQGISSNQKLSGTINLVQPLNAQYANYAISMVTNYELTRKGLRFNNNAERELTGGLIITPESSKYTIRDHLHSDTVDRSLTITDYDTAGTLLNNWLTNYTATTNVANQDAITFDIDMLNTQGAGASLRLKSVTPLNLIEINGKKSLEAGSFTYEYSDPSAQGPKFNLRVSVDADPAFLNVEIDQDVNGSYEKSGRLAQEDFSFNF
jgi:hypothetical protein